MTSIQDSDTRYFVEIEVRSLKVTRCAFDQRENLDQGRQADPDVHRLFLTKGQYNKFVERCRPWLGAVLGR